jgi:hypothetical protein
MMSETFSDHECAVLYLGWRLEKPLACPECGAHVTSYDDAKAGWGRSRRFTCDGCGRTGAHLVQDPASSAQRGNPAGPSPTTA